MFLTFVVFVIVVAHPFVAVSHAQQLLDRVLARVNGDAITLSDARAASALGLVEIPRGADPIPAATRGLIDRQLMLAEVARFSPPEPEPFLLDGEVKALEGRVGGRVKLDALMTGTGITEMQIREMARDTLRIQAYLGQRFGASTQGQSVEQWVRDLRRRATIVCQISGC